jgi:hypothetical protein
MEYIEIQSKMIEIVTPEDLDPILTRIGALEAHVSSLTALPDRINILEASITARLTAIELGLSSLESLLARMDYVEGRLVDMQRLLLPLPDRLTALEDRVAALEAKHPIDDPPPPPPPVDLGPPLLHPWQAIVESAPTGFVLPGGGGAACTYHFDQKPLPNIHILTKSGREVTVTCDVLLNSKSVTTLQPVTVSKTDTRVRASNSVNTDVGAIRWENTLDYDSWCWCTLTIPAGTKIGDLRLQLQMPVADAPITCGPGYNHPDAASWGTLNGSFENPEWYFGSPLGRGAYQSTIQAPGWWIGDEEAGISFIPESDRNWVHTDGITQVQAYTNQRKGIRYIQGRIITKPVTTIADTTIEFAIAATPTRPPDPNQAEKRTFVIGDYDPNIIGTSPKHNTFLWSGDVYRYGSCLPIDGEPTHLQAHITKHRGWYPGGLFLYHQMLDLPVGRGHEPLKIYHDGVEWQSDRTISGVSTVDSCGAEQGYFDAYLGYIRRELEETAGDSSITGVYLDTVGPWWCDNPNHKSHGAPQPDAFGRLINRVWNVRSMREVYMTIYQKCIAANKQVMYHCHERYTPGVHTWCHWMVPGEESHKHVKAPGEHGDNEFVYTDYYSSKYWRSLSRVGIPYLYISQYGRATGGTWIDRKHTGPVLGMLAVHGQNVYGGYVERTTVAEWQKFRRDNNIDSAKFHPYWRQTRFTANVAGIWISYYEKPDGNLMLVIMNKTPDVLVPLVSELGSVTVAGRTHQCWTNDGQDWKLGYEL